jgi:hypothetical protein
MNTICLYGNMSCGAGYLAQGNDGRMFGTGDPVKGCSFNDAVWLACLDLKEAGYRGTVRVFCAGGKRIADTTIENPPYFGDLKWTAATIYVISVEAIEAEAKAQGN